MGGGARFLLSLFLPAHLLPTTVDAGIVVNELYYDHPGADAGYEFVELWNTGATAVSLDGLALEFHNGSGAGWAGVWRAPDGLVLAPEVAFVIGGSALSPAADVVVELALQNGPDAIRIVDAFGAVLDLVGYGGLDDAAYVETLGAAAVAAGESIARTPDGRDSGNNAADFFASAPTPKRRNVARHDAAIVPGGDTPVRSGRARAGTERVALDLENRGLAGIPAGAVLIAARDSSALGGGGLAPVSNQSLVAPGGRERVVLDVPLSHPGYHWIDVVARYPADERPGNDVASFLRRVGRPPLIVSEIMSAPRAGCPQFVEFYNAGGAAIDLAGYSLRDTRSQAAGVAAGPLLVDAHDFVVVTADAADLRACTRARHAFDVNGAWPAFNKSGGDIADSVVVSDAFGIAVDAVAYPGVPPGVVDRSLERVDLFAAEEPRAAVWRLSNERGGSPGRANDGALETVPRVACDASPNPFFPRDGEILRVAIAPSPGIASVVVRVYDPSGRRVFEMGSASAFPAVLLWDGRGQDGAWVRAGVYLLSCESFAADGARVGVEKVVVGCASRSP